MGVTWRRADLGDTPEVGAIISAVIYHSDAGAGVIVYHQMEVISVLLARSGVVVSGPNLPCDIRFPLPERPKNITGKRAFLWRPYEEVEPSSSD